MQSDIDIRRHQRFHKMRVHHNDAHHDLRCADRKGLNNQDCQVLVRLLDRTSLESQA